jgi:hypothetical protein
MLLITPASGGEWVMLSYDTATLAVQVTIRAALLICYSSSVFKAWGWSVRDPSTRASKTSWSSYVARKTAREIIHTYPDWKCNVTTSSCDGTFDPTTNKSIIRPQRTYCWILCPTCCSSRNIDHNGGYPDVAWSGYISQRASTIYWWANRSLEKGIRWSLCVYAIGLNLLLGHGGTSWEGGRCIHSNCPARTRCSGG